MTIHSIKTYGTPLLLFVIIAAGVLMFNSNETNITNDQPTIIETDETIVVPDEEIIDPVSGANPVLEEDGSISVSSFDECAQQGGFIAEIFPRECIWRELSFVEEAAPNGCVVAGCSSELCLSAEVAQEQGVSICLWQEEYACYATAACEMQSTGECGWTQTDELTMCISNLSSQQ